jgi:hypothetical protein
VGKRITRKAGREGRVAARVLHGINRRGLVAVWKVGGVSGKGGWRED